MDNEQDERNNTDDTENGDIYVNLPFRQRSCQTCIDAGRGNFLALCIKDEERHIEEKHRLLNIVYRCIRCNKTSGKIRSIYDHIPRCQGRPREQAVEEGQLPCEDCARNFVSSRALATHQRHAHPVTRNRIREAQLRETENPRPQPNPRPNSVWTQQEVEQLRQLEVQMAHERFINKPIARVLTTKTSKQISDKRSDIRSKEGARRQLEVEIPAKVLREPVRWDVAEREPWVNRLRETWDSLHCTLTAHHQAYDRELDSAFGEFIPIIGQVPQSKVDELYSGLLTLITLGD